MKVAKVTAGESNSAANLTPYNLYPNPEPCRLQYDSAEWEPAFLRQAREFLFFPLLPREASK